MIIVAVETRISYYVRIQCGVQLTDINHFCIQKRRIYAYVLFLNRIFEFSDGDDLVLNGSKAFISGAGTSDVYAVMVRTDPSTKAGCNILVILNNF